MAWQLDPEFVLHSRLTFGRSVPYWWMATWAAAIAAIIVAPHGDPLWQGLLLTPGLCLLFLAFPYAAIQVLTLERDGRFDQHRLAGRPPLGLGLAVLGGSSWVLWLSAALLIAAALRVETSVSKGDLAAVLACGVLSGIVLLAVPSGRTETWLLRAAVLLAGVAVAIAPQLELGATRALDGYGLRIAVIGAIGAAVFVPAALRRLYRPRSSPGGMPSTIVRPLVDLNRSAFPHAVRALLGSGAGAAGALVIAAAAVVWIVGASHSPAFRDPERREWIAVALLGAPVLLAAYNCSRSAARERETGALDLLRLTEPRATLALQLAAGYSLPYLIITAAVAAALVASGWHDADYVIALLPLAAFTLMGAGLAEGLRSRPVGLYLIATLWCLGTRPAENVAVLCAGWIVWTVAARALRDPSAAPLTGIAAVAASAHVGVIATLQFAHSSYSAVGLAGIAALPVGLLVPDGRPGTRASIRAACALAAGVGGAVALWVPGLWGSYSTFGNWPHWFFIGAPLPARLLFAFTVGVAIASGLLLGWLLHNLYGRTPMASRVIRLMPAVFGVCFLPLVFLLPGVKSLADKIAAAIGWSRYMIVDWLALFAMMLSIVVLMAIERRRVTPRTRA